MFGHSSVLSQFVVFPSSLEFKNGRRRHKAGRPLCSFALSVKSRWYVRFLNSLVLTIDCSASVQIADDRMRFTHQLRDAKQLARRKRIRFLQFSITAFINFGKADRMIGAFVIPVFSDGCLETTNATSRGWPDTLAATSWCPRRVSTALMI